MLTHLKRLFSDSIIFSIVTLGTRLVSLLLTPIYAAYLSTVSFADWDQVNIFTQILTVICILGTDSAMVFYFFDASQKSERRKYFSAALLFSATFCASISLLIYIFDDQVTSLVFNTPANSLWILPIAASSTVAALIIQHCLAYARYARRIRLFVSFSILYVAGTNILSLCLVIYTPSLSSIVWGQLIGQGLVAFTLLLIFSKEIMLKIPWSYIVDLIKYGAPLLPALLSFLILTASPRALLYHLDSDQNAAIYGIVLRVSSFINLLTAPFFLAWRPFSMSIKGREDAPDIFGLVSKIILVAGTLMIMIIQFFMEPLLNLYVPKYSTGFPYVWVLSLSTLLNMLHTVLGVGLLIKKQTRVISYIFVLMSPLSLIGSYFLIPVYHIWGAVASTLIPYVLIIMLIIWRNQVTWPINLNVIRIVSYLGIYLLCMILLSIIQFNSLVHAWAYYIGLLVVVCLSILAFKLIPIDQLKNIGQFVSQAIKMRSKE